jgi:DNA-binding HxlR family transcriptional regulator
MSMYERKITEDLDCGIIVAMKFFGSKWKPCIIDAISSGVLRPAELHRYLSMAPARVIDMQLKELVDYGVVEKTVFGGFPLKVEYSLTAVGESILPILKQMNSWGAQHRELVKELHSREVMV